MEPMPRLRPPALKAADPIAAIVSTFVIVAASAGLFAKLGLTSEQIVVIESALLAALAAVRTLYEARNAKRIEGIMADRESIAYLDGIRRAHVDTISPSDVTPPSGSPLLPVVPVAEAGKRVARKG